MKKQNRENLPASILEERRFFQLLGKRKDATPKGWNNPDNWKELEDIPEGAPFGFSVTNNSDYLLIDADHVIDDNGEMLPEAQAAIDRIFHHGDIRTYSERSISGHGKHYLLNLGTYADSFSYITNSIDSLILFMPVEKYRALSEEEQKATPKIELFYRTGGRYVVLTGDNDGDVVEVATDEEAAAVFRECIKLIAECHPNETDQEEEAARPVDDATKERIKKALKFIDSDNYDTWVRIGIALRNSGMPFEVWDEWSRTRKDGTKNEKYDDGKDLSPDKKWKSFAKSSRWNAGTIFRMAKEAGWTETVEADSQAASSGKLSTALTCVSDVEEQAVEWLLPGYFPKGEISLLGGDGGSCKTFVWVNVAAGVSIGRRPLFLGSAEYNPYDGDDLPGGAGRVVYFSGEDSTSKVLIKRLKACGADLTKVFCLTTQDERLRDVKFGSSFLRSIISEWRPALCIFDPLQSFIPPDIHMAERNAMRQAVQPLSELGATFGTSFLIICHTNKRGGVSGRTRLADSADLWDISRSVCFAGATADPGVKYFSQEKCNYGALSETVLFSVENNRCVFKGISQKRDYEFQTERQQPRQTPVRDEAKQFILESLADGEMVIADLDKAASAVGISKNTLARAKKDLKEDGTIVMRMEKNGKETRWVVSLADSSNVEKVENGVVCYGFGG